MRRGAQVSIEYLLVTGFSFLLLAPVLLVFYIHFDALQDDMVNRQALTAAQTLVQSAERVYYAGSPSQETVTVRIPPHISRFEVLENAIVLTTVRGPPKDVVFFTENIFLPQALDERRGVRTFVVKATPFGVEITE